MSCSSALVVRSFIECHSSYSHIMGRVSGAIGRSLLCRRALHGATSLVCTLEMIASPPSSATVTSSVLLSFCASPSPRLLLPSLIFSLHFPSSCAWSLLPPPQASIQPRPCASLPQPRPCALSLKRYAHLALLPVSFGCAIMCALFSIPGEEGTRCP